MPRQKYLNDSSLRKQRISYVSLFVRRQGDRFVPQIKMSSVTPGQLFFYDESSMLLFRETTASSVECVCLRHKKVIGCKKYCMTRCSLYTRKNASHSARGRALGSTTIDRQDRADGKEVVFSNASSIVLHPSMDFGMQVLYILSLRFWVPRYF